MKMIIPGGSGFLGTYLAEYFSNKGWEIIILSRSPKKDSEKVRHLFWDGKTLGEWSNELDAADVIVNMAGRTVNCRYTQKNKAEILNSRIDSTRILGEAVSLCKKPPKLWINSSSATYYKDTRGDLPANDEYTGQTGNDFSMGVCQAWEKEFLSAADSINIRKIALRSSIVIGKQGGALLPLLGLVKKYLGGIQGPGNQYISWIHIHDFARTVDFLIERDDIEGPLNCTAPNPVMNKDFMAALRKACNVPFGLAMPVWLLEFGAILIQTQTELVLKSRKVVSKKLAEAGFEFEFPTIEAAFDEILNKIKS